MSDTLVRRLDWRDVALGHVLNSHILPSPEEKAAFDGWVCPVNAPPNWRRFGFWNAFGQKVAPLNGLPAPMFLTDVLGDPRDEYIVQKGVLIYTQDVPPPNPARVYAPIRRKRLGIRSYHFRVGSNLRLASRHTVSCDSLRRQTVYTAVRVPLRAAR